MSELKILQKHLNCIKLTPAWPCGRSSEKCKHAGKLRRWIKCVLSLPRQLSSSPLKISQGRDYFPEKLMVQNKTKLAGKSPKCIFGWIVLEDQNRGQQTHKSTGPSTGSIIHWTANPISPVLNVFFYFFFFYVITVIREHNLVYFGRRCT